MLVCVTYIYSVTTHQVILVTEKGFKLKTAACEWINTDGRVRDAVVLVCMSQKEWGQRALP